MERFGRSGLTQAEFCRRAKLHPMTFSQWRRQAKSKPLGFAEVQVSAPVLGSAAVLHLADGIRLELALDGDAAWAGLGLLLNTLQSCRP